MLHPSLKLAALTVPSKCKRIVIVKIIDIDISYQNADHRSLTPQKWFLRNVCEHNMSKKIG